MVSGSAIQLLSAEEELQLNAHLYSSAQIRTDLLSPHTQLKMNTDISLDKTSLTPGTLH